MEEGKKDLKYRVYMFSLEMIRMVDTIDSSRVSTQVILKQVIRSATSVGANVVEAQAGSSRKDFANFYHYSLKSANETKYWLGLLRDSKKISKEYANRLLDEVTELSNILGKSIVTLKKKK